MVVKRKKTRRKISLSSEEKENYESDIEDKTDPNQASNDKYLLQF